MTINLLELPQGNILLSISELFLNNLQNEQVLGSLNTPYAMHVKLAFICYLLWVLFLSASSIQPLSTLKCSNKT